MTEPLDARDGAVALLDVGRSSQLSLAELCFPSVTTPEVFVANKVQANKNLRVSTPSSKLIRIQVGAQRRELRTRVTRMAKTLIAAERRQQQFQQYSEKLSRFRLRTHISERAHLHRSWATFAMLLTSCQSILVRIQHRYAAREQACLLLGWCSVVFRCVGKLRILLANNRRRRALRVRVT